MPTERTIRVLSPVSPQGVKQRPLTPRPGSLEGMRVGFLDNGKHNAGKLFQRIGALLKERYGVAAVVHRRKGNAALAAPGPILAELAHACDLVVTGSGD